MNVECFHNLSQNFVDYLLQLTVKNENMTIYFFRLLHNEEGMMEALLGCDALRRVEGEHRKQKIGEFLQKYFKSWKNI